jgi:23S rRNA (cytosine1962-C5)-methyltransferase
VLPCLIFEDDHLLVANKPAGLNTHAPSPYAGEGLYDWLRHREARWAQLAIIHRLDKDTSGVIVFAKTPLANRSLTAQFTARNVRKKYLLLTDRPVRQGQFTIKSSLVRAGERYVNRPVHSGGETAETRFGEGRRKNAECRSGGWCHVVEAEPLTGRTHQIRVHAAEGGFPILGDTLYGGTAASRVYLHAAELTLKHPASGEELTFRAPTGQDWEGVQARGQAVNSAKESALRHPEHGRDALHRLPNTYEQGPGATRPYHPGSEVRAEGSEAREQPAGPLPCLALRDALIEPAATNAYRVIHGASDGWPGWYVERLGEYLHSQSGQALRPAECEELARCAEGFSARGVYHKVLTRQTRRAARAEASPQLVVGEAAPERFKVQENGLQFELSFTEGYSTGLFLDQRDNRRRLLTRHVASDFPLLAPAIGNGQWELLNLFAYTCGFSVCAAKAGARTTSLDLSRRWLDWGKRNFALNQLEPAGHEFIYGEAFDWLRRLAKKGRRFEVILLDPPTFSQSKESGVFQAEKDYSRLVAAALPLLGAGGALFASTNAADWTPDKFLAAVDKAIHAAGRRVLQRHYVPQPPDFPVSRAEPAYLKTAWLRVK